MKFWDIEVVTNSKLDNDIFVVMKSLHPSSEFSVVDVWYCSCDKYMKSIRERTMGMKRFGTHPIVIPNINFSISLCSVPVH